MTLALHTSMSRGYARYSWLDTYYSFSFAGYFNPERMGFGALRVLNDDTIAPGGGFDTHPHDNMEIITIPLSGALAHRDSMRHEQVVSAGEIQVMSAGTGIFHSEYNASDEDPVRLLQIWVRPREQGVTPRYDQMSLDGLRKRNQLYQVVSPNPDDGGLWIHQDAWFSLGEFDAGVSDVYRRHSDGSGVYLFCIEGGLDVAGATIRRRDALALSDVEMIEMEAFEESRFLLMEVPFAPRAKEESQ